MTDDQIAALDLSLMALCVWREARYEPDEGKLAVAFTIVNRAQHPGWWGDSPYAVVTRPMQYSSMTYPGDQQLWKYPGKNDPNFGACMQAAADALAGRANPVPGADSYYADYIPAPKWADPKKFVRKIGRHLFFNLDGDPGMKKLALDLQTKKE